MSRRLSRSLVGFLAGLVLAVTLLAPGGVAAAQPPPTPTDAPTEIVHIDVATRSSSARTDVLAALTRVSGPDRYATAVAVSRRAFASRPAATVYLARGDVLADALAGGALTDGPVLLLPPAGAVPAAVRAEIRRLDPGRVVALGGASVVSDARLAEAAAGRATGRLAGDSRHGTAAAISRAAFPGRAEEVYLARDVDPADALAGGALTAGPVLLVPSSGALPAAVTTELKRLAPARVLALGGPAVVTAAALDRAAATAGGANTGRLAGADRYATSVRIARHAFPGGARTAYLAGGTAPADAVASGSLTDGPILLVPPPGLVSPSATAGVAAALGDLRVAGVVVIGGESAVSTATVTGILTATEAPPAPVPPPPGPSTRTAGYCDRAIGRTWPVPRPASYTIACVDRIDADVPAGMVVFGLTRTLLYDDGTVEGSIEVLRGQSDAMVDVTIVHELAHAYSYAFLTDRQREWFARRIGRPSWSSGTYLESAPEVWANTQATCAGYPAPDIRPAVACTVLDETEASAR